MNKKFYSQEYLNGAVLDLARQIVSSGFVPDYIVGLTRGGLIPSVMLSHYLNVPLETLKVSMRDDGECETNCWMSEDAYNGTRILIVDDINDTGATINWIKQDWRTSCFPDDPAWETIWGNTVRSAVITHNHASAAEVDYFVDEVNKAEKDVWLVYPWENFWFNNAI